MAKTQPQPEVKTQVKQENDRDQFRRTAALSILGAYVGRHGGFTPAERETHMRLVWEYADVFVDLEHAPPLAQSPAPGTENSEESRPASPADEWGVIDGDDRRRGWCDKQAAEWYAASRSGARVVQLSGPGADPEAAGF